ncbi:terpenoid synthase [Multifurca ochricompacta]|uniref:Terpene synthase n=1 Tax=Multifurca ochricompacta TaxID=376703 RepID=A0AAD4MAD4_9AGAM|nr:terpenoid synthase [Multifurca ochricompacta]
MSNLPQFYLPDSLAQWPWPRILNKHYAEVKPESDCWLGGFEALDVKSQRSFDLCNFHGLRVACDLMVLFFIYDEFTDKVSGDGARIYADMVVGVLLNPHMERPKGESKLGEITRQFWLRAIKVASEPAQRRFILSFTRYVYGVISEASDRADGRIRSIVDYLELRRLTAGAYASFFSAELGLDIPDEVMAHPAMESLLALAAESIVLTNDLYSYNNEQAAGHGGHNIITVVMSERGVDLDGALNWVAEYHGKVLSGFQAQHRMLPSWGPEMDSVVQSFIERLAYWTRGHDCWSFESGRYFGSKGPEIKKHRLVTLLPRVETPDVTPMMAPLMARLSDTTVVSN